MRAEKNLINWNTFQGNELIKAFMHIKTPDLMRLFLDDLLTKEELEKCVKKLFIVKLIILGTPYEYIIQQTGVSPKVIAKISKQLDYKHGGFNEIIQKMYPNGFRYFD